MVPRRVIVNIVVFLVASAALVTLGVTQLLLRGGEGGRITAEFSDVGGLKPRNDVTMRGVKVGSVTGVRLTPTGAEADITLDPGIEVARGSQLVITRRSPIGDLTVEITPGAGEPLESGSRIPRASTKPPPDAGRTVEVLADLLRAVPGEDLQVVVHELATALEGRGDDLARLSVVAADLPERILEVNEELVQLFETAPEVTGVFAENADVLADDIRRTAVLADILRDRRFDLVDLYRNGARFSRVAGDLVADEKQNISCLIRDFAHINSVMARPTNLRNLVATLRLNPFFFRGADIVKRTGLDKISWFRVQLLPHTEPQARQYEPQRPPPDVFAGNGCTSPFGAGVGATTKAAGSVNLAPGSSLHEGK